MKNSCDSTYGSTNFWNSGSEALSAIGLRVGAEVEKKEGIVRISGEAVEMDMMLADQVLITV